MKRKLAIAGIVVGAVLALGPVWGLLVSVLGMERAFSVLGGTGISDPGALSSSIAVVLRAQVFGMIACPFGIVLCILCAMKLQSIRRQPPHLPAPEQGTPISKA